jgi:hypothetical protein
MRNQSTALHCTGTALRCTSRYLVCFLHTHPNIEHCCCSTRFHSGRQSRVGCGNRAVGVVATLEGDDVILRSAILSCDISLLARDFCRLSLKQDTANCDIDLVKRACVHTHWSFVSASHIPGQSALLYHHHRRSWPCAPPPPRHS